ncbi:hypothetical protein J2Z50_003302 [Ensifer mexicanus]|nr:hypothetical protein [Sinorhizobium mexicanum]
MLEQGAEARHPIDVGHNSVNRIGGMVVATRFANATAASVSAVLIAGTRKPFAPMRVPPSPRRRQNCSQYPHVSSAI